MFPERSWRTPNDYLRRNFLTPAKDVFNHASDLAEQYHDNPTGLRKALYNQVMSTLLNQDSSGKIMRGREVEWRAGLEKILDHQGQAAQWTMDRAAETGLGVRDPAC